MSFFNPGWYVIYTRPQQEKKVAKHLEEKKVAHFLPMVKKSKQWHDRKKVVQVPLFPSYLFVLLHEQKHYYDVINNNTGFLYFVKAGKENARIDKEVIKNIQIILTSATEVESTTEYIKPGKQIIISKGPFAGLSCEVVQCNQKSKIVVKLDLLNRSVITTIPEEYLL